MFRISLQKISKNRLDSYRKSTSSYLVSPFPFPNTQFPHPVCWTSNVEEYTE